MLEAFEGDDSNVTPLTAREETDSKHCLSQGLAEVQGSLGLVG